MNKSVKCRRDCEYYSRYTENCDYSLRMYKSRGCPSDACTQYKPRCGRRRFDGTYQVAEAVQKWKDTE